MGAGATRRAHSQPSVVLVSTSGIICIAFNHACTRLTLITRDFTSSPHRVIIPQPVTWHQSLDSRCVWPLHLGILLTTFLATERSWNTKLKGSAVNLLLQTICTYLTKTKTSYAKCTTIVNSSGMGKSRTVDELSKRIITVPICLRADFTGGSGF